MTNLSKLSVVIGCLLLLLAVVLKVVGIPYAAVKPSSFLILANTSFILAVLFKK